MTVAVAGLGRPGPSLRLIRSLAERPIAGIGSVLALGVVAIALLAPILAPRDPAATDFAALLLPPLVDGHLLGTDDLGRDVLSRVIWGAQASMEAGVLAMLLAMLVAVPVGLVVGYYRGPLDTVGMRLTDAMLAFPYLILAVGLAVLLGPSITNATIAIGFVQIPKLVRVTRGEVLALREETFVEAAHSVGAGDARIIFRHILPNVVNTLLVQGTIIVPYAIIAESSLSFLGLGVQPPTPSWGVMLTTAQPYMDRAPWLALAPGLAISIATVSFNLFGDGLRDAIDPRLR